MAPHTTTSKSFLPLLVAPEEPAAAAIVPAAPPAAPGSPTPCALWSEPRWLRYDTLLLTDPLLDGWRLVCLRHRKQGVIAHAEIHWTAHGPAAAWRCYVGRKMTQLSTALAP